MDWTGPLPSLSAGAKVHPRAYRRHLAIPVVYAIIGGEPERVAPLVDLYRRANEQAGHPSSSQHVTFGGIGLIAPRFQDAKDGFYPYWARQMRHGVEARGWRVPSRADYDHYVRGSRMLLAGSPNETADHLITIGGLVRADRYALQMDWSGSRTRPFCGRSSCTAPRSGRRSRPRWARRATCRRRRPSARRRPSRPESPHDRHDVVPTRSRRWASECRRSAER